MNSTGLNRLAIIWQQILTSQILVLTARVKSQFEAQITTTIDPMWVTDVTLGKDEITDFGLFLEKYGQPKEIEMQDGEVTMQFSIERFGRYGENVMKMAAGFVAYMTTFGHQATFLLRREYKDLLEQWICNARDWDWCYRTNNRTGEVIRGKDGSPIVWRGHFARLIKSNGYTNPRQADEALCAQVAEHHSKSVYHVKGVGLLTKCSENRYEYSSVQVGCNLDDETPIYHETKTPIRDKDGWIKAGTKIRALNIALALIEDHECDCSGEVGSLMEIGSDRETGAFTNSDYANAGWTNRYSQENLAELRQMEEDLHRIGMVTNSSTHPLGRGRDQLPDDDYENERYHDNDRQIRMERGAILDNKDSDQGRLVKVATMDAQLFQQDVLMQTVMRGSKSWKQLKANMGEQRPWISKLQNSNDRLSGKPQRNRNAFQNMMHYSIEDPTGFEVVMHRFINNPESWMPNVIRFLDDTATRKLHQKNKCVHAVSIQVPTPWGTGRWVSMQYKSGYKALWLVFDIGQLHRSSGSCFKTVVDNWKFVGIHITGDMANSVVRKLGYKVDWCVADKIGENGEVLKHVIKPVWNVPGRPVISHGGYVRTPDYIK